MKKIPSIIAYLVVAVAPLCWAGDVVLAKSVSKIIPPFSLAFWRWTIAFFILLPVSFRHIKRDWPVIRQSWKIIFLLSVLGMSIFIVLIYTALQTTSAINSSLIQTAMPGAIVLFCFVLYGERISFFQILGLFFCFGGAAYVVLQGSLSHVLEMAFVKGDILMIIASFMYGFYSALLQKAPSMNPLSFLALTSGIGAFTLLPMYLYEIAIKQTFVVNLASISGIFYVALFPSIVAYLCWNKGIATIGANKTGIFISLIPIFATVLAMLFLGETIQSYHLIGMGMVLTGMMMFNKHDYPNI